MKPLRYMPVTPDVRVVFHSGDGKEHVIAADEPYTTDDPALIAYLDAHEHVKRATAKAAR